MTKGDSERPERRFAPLDPRILNEYNAPKLRGIVFDVDGTLCLPQNHMFRDMRAALQIPKSIDILDHIRSLASQPEAQKRAIEAVKDIERNAMTEQTPQPGLQELMVHLQNRGVRKALCTRNFLLPVQHLLDTFLPGVAFEPVITRESEGLAPKPSPEGIWSIAQSWSLGEEVMEELGVKELAEIQGDMLEWARVGFGSGLIMVGDSIDDLVAGRRAGAATVLLMNEENSHLKERQECDLVIERLDDLVGVLDKGFESRS